MNMQRFIIALIACVTLFNGHMYATHDADKNPVTRADTVLLSEQAPGNDIDDALDDALSDAEEQLSKHAHDITTEHDEESQPINDKKEHFALALKFIRYLRHELAKKQFLPTGFGKIFYDGTQFTVNATAKLAIALTALLMIASMYKMYRISALIFDIVYNIVDGLGNNVVGRAIYWLLMIHQHPIFQQQPEKTVFEVVCTDTVYLERMVQQLGMSGFFQAVQRYPYWHSLFHGCYAVARPVTHGFLRRG